MLSRSEKQTVTNSNRKRKIRIIFLRLINLVFKTYAFLGFIYLTALVAVNVIYKSYLHQEPPFDYQLYIHSDHELIALLSVIITSIVFSGFIALVTNRRNRVRKPVKTTVQKETQVHRRRRRRRAA